MPRLLYCSLLTLVLLSTQSMAGQPTVSQPPPLDTGDNEMLKALLDQMRDKNLKNTEDGMGLVPVRRARLCDICSQPLYKHVDNFECIPLDKDTGRLKVLLKIRSVPAKCPVCASDFNAALRGNVNSDGGLDRDFCAHSVGQYTVHSNVWMCPDCGYAGFSEGFGLGLDGKPLGDDVKTFVREKLTEPTRKRMITVAGINAANEAQVPEDLKRFGRYVTQTEIPDWVKYDNALQIFEKIKPGHTLLATLYRDAAYACRREVCSEVAVPGLHNSLQVSLGTSIRRVNFFLQSESMSIRRKRGENVFDPTKPELDQRILAQAAANIIKLGEDLGAQMTQRAAKPDEPVKAGARAEDNYLRTGDMYVLCIRHAGALDRLGRIPEAEKALEKARKFIPEKVNVNVDNVRNKELEDYFERQMKLLRGTIDDRLECLRREKEYLFNAARSNLAAIKFKEVVLKEAGKAQDEKKTVDPAPTSYLLGEWFRRAAALTESAAFFGAADLVLTKYLERLEIAEKEKTIPLAEIDLQRERWRDLKAMNDEQRALVKAKDAPDEYVKAIVDMLLQSGGVAAGTAPTQPVATPRDPVATPNTLTSPEKTPLAAVSTGSIKTREELFQMYFEALKKYRAEKNENPATLSDLVKGGYVKAEDSCLDAAGKLFCPATKEKLLYQRTWQPGDKNACVIYPIKAGTPSLFADGFVQVGLIRK